MKAFVFLLLLLIVASTTYNSYLLRGGKLAMSQILMVLGMLCLIFSQVLGVVGMDNVMIYQLSLQNILFVQINVEKTAKYFFCESQNVQQILTFQRIAEVLLMHFQARLNQ